MTPQEILKREDADSCPFGLVRVSDKEIAVAANALTIHSDNLLSEQGARNLAYSVLTALRHAHFNWHDGEDGR